MVKFIYTIIAITVVYFSLVPVLSIIYSGLLAGDSVDDLINIFERGYPYLKNSLQVSIPVTIISTLFGLISSITLWRVRFFGRKILKVLILFPLINPPFVGSIAFIMLFGRRGLITNKLLGLSISPFGYHGIIVMQTIGLSTLAYLIISSAIKKTNIDYENAARNLGSSERELFFKVTLPLMKPEITISAMLVFLSSMADFGTPLIIGGPFQTLASDLYIQITGLYDLNTAIISGILLLIPSFMAFSIQKYYSEKNTYISQISSSKDIEYRDIKRSVKVVLVGITGLFIAFILLQYGFILIGAFTNHWGHDYSFTLRHFRRVLDTNITPFVNTVKLAFGVSIVSSFIGVLLSYLLKFRKLRTGKAIDFIVTLPAAVPGILFGLGYLVTFKYPLFGLGTLIFKNVSPVILLGTGIIIYIICIYRYMYVGLKTGYSLMENLDPNLELAANNLGAGELRVFVEIIFPILKPAFIAAFIKNFTSTMTTIGAIIFLIIPRNRVAVQQILQILTSSEIGVGAAMSIMLSSLSLFLVVIFLLIINYKAILKKLRGV